jgi:glycosyltransferase involved in cell wall biosynthesis
MNAASRLAFFLPSLAGGGAERVVLNLARGFAERGHFVDLVLATKTGPFLDDVPDSLRLVSLDRKRIAMSIPSLVSYLSRAKPKALISSMTHCNVAAIAASMLCRHSTSIIVTEHVAMNESQVNPGSRTERLLPPLARLLYPKVQAIVAVSHGVAEQLESNLGLPKEKISVVYNPIVGDALHEKANEPLGHSWFAAGEPPVIVAAGRLSTQKNFAMLVTALSFVRRRRAVRLLILGEGEKRSELQTQVDSLGLSSDVDMIGFVQNPYKYMRGAKVFVLSSLYEGFANVIVEAMACGTPVISTDCPSGPSEILDGGRWGRLVPVGDAAAMATAIEASLDESVHPDVRRRSEDFTIEKSVDAYSLVIDGALGHA